MKFPSPPQPKGITIESKPVLPLWLDLAHIGSVIGLCVISGLTLLAYLKI